MLTTITTPADVRIERIKAQVAANKAENIKELVRGYTLANLLSYTDVDYVVENKPVSINIVDINKVSHVLEENQTILSLIDFQIYRYDPTNDDADINGFVSFKLSLGGGTDRFGTISVKDFYGNNLASAVSDAIDYAVYNNKATVLVDVEGNHIWDQEVEKINTSEYNLNGLKIEFLPNCIPTLNLGEERGTIKALLKLKGNQTFTNLGTLSTAITRGRDTFTLAGHNLIQGDNIRFNTNPNNLPYDHALGIDYGKRGNCNVESVNGDIVTLDRPVPDPIPIGSQVIKYNPIIGINIIIPEIRFEGNYGFGVLLYDGKNCQVRVEKATKIASKVIELAGCVDCFAYLGNGEYGTDVAGTGGHSYGIRLSVSNDCRAEGYGSSLRHVVDLTGASRNKVTGSGRKGYSSDFLTHGNGCRSNYFYNLDCRKNLVGCLSFDPSNQDIDNVVLSSYLEDTPIYRAQEGKNSLSASVISVVNRYSIAQPGNHYYSNCIYDLRYGLTYPTNNCNLVIKDSTLYARSSRCLMTGGSTNNVENNTLTLLNCDLIIENGVLALESGANMIFHMIGGSITVVGSHGDSTPLIAYGKIILDNVKINNKNISNKWLIGTFNSGSVEIKNCQVSSVGGTFNLIKPLNLYTNLKIGPNIYDSYSGLTNNFSNKNIRTIGSPIIVLRENDISTYINSFPIAGIWTAGDRITTTNSNQQLLDEIICVTSGAPGQWKKIYDKSAIVNNPSELFSPSDFNAVYTPSELNTLRADVENLRQIIIQSLETERNANQRNT